MSFKHLNRTTPAVMPQMGKVQFLERMSRSYTYNSSSRTLTLNGFPIKNVGGDFLNIVYGR